MKKYYLGFLSILIVACSNEVKSIDYYLENIDEAKIVVEKCEVKQLSQQDQNCSNAKDAIYRNDMNSKFGGY